MGASTRVATPSMARRRPSNPHPYPWMNSLFQDGVDDLAGCSARSLHRQNHAKAARLFPERIVRLRCSNAPRTNVMTEARLFHESFASSSDALMTDQEDSANFRRSGSSAATARMGDIGYPERLEGLVAEPSEHQDSDARHAGVFQYRRPEFGIRPRCSAATT